MDLISVIVPVYRVEPYLNRCVESLVAQTYRNLEIILVDDGSPDKCPEICDIWAQKDARIRVIHQKNGGGGSARNAALDIAQGEYLAFVDSDDFIAPDMMMYLHNLFSDGVDVVECGYCLTEDDTATFDAISASCNIKIYTRQEAMREHIHDQIFRQLIWNKLYRRQAIGEIRFPIGKQIDDEFWTYRVIGNCNKLIWSDKVLYAYRQQSNSVMHSLSKEGRMHAIEAKVERHKYLSKVMPELTYESAQDLWLSCLYQGQQLLKENTDSENKQAWNYMKTCLKQYPIPVATRKNPMTLRIWLSMEKISLGITCRIRNMLKIGE